MGCEMEIPTARVGPVTLGLFPCRMQAALIGWAYKQLMISVE
jgi:hypothetical protein